MVSEASFRLLITCVDELGNCCRAYWWRQAFGRSLPGWGGVRSKAEGKTQRGEWLLVLGEEQLRGCELHSRHWCRWGCETNPVALLLWAGLWAGAKPSLWDTVDREKTLWLFVWVSVGMLKLLYVTSPVVCSVCFCAGCARSARLSVRCTTQQDSSSQESLLKTFERLEEQSASRHKT